MIILENRKFIEAKFSNEQEIEDLVIKFSEHFFGPSSIFIPKTKIQTYDGFGTIPDGFAINISSGIWYLVEAELIHHSLWSHIVPQITKQLSAISRPETSQIITEIVVNMLTENPTLNEKFQEENIKPINIRKVLGEILKKPPIIGIPIDNISKDLEQWAKSLRNDIRIWVVKKYIEFGNSKNIAYDIPEEFSPTLEILEKKGDSNQSIRRYEVTVTDLIEKSLLSVNQELSMTYGPGGTNRKKYKAIINLDGSFSVNENIISSPSYAALYCIQDAGSNRKTVNGWTSWKTENGESLSEIRENFLLDVENNGD